MLEKEEKTKTFKIKTLGCKVNQSESEGINNMMLASGLKSGEHLTNSDIIIINTCSVTKKAEIESKRTIRKIIHKNSKAKLIVTGCYAQTSLEELKKIKSIDFVCPNKAKHEIVRTYIEKDKKNKSRANTDIFFSQSFQQNFPKNRTRPLIKIQDGCNSFCAYCIVPYARGRSKSLSENKIFAKISTLRLNGYMETVLTGVHIGNYGKDLSPKSSLFKLLCEIIKNKLIKRLRISSIEPMELSKEIIQLTKDSQILKSSICAHFHIPIQTGNDYLLQKMRRPYNQKYVVKLIKSILAHIPTCGIGLDIMVGFPGEDESSFEDTYRLVEKLEIAYLHVFPFSPRRGTLAWNYGNKVDQYVIKKRCEKIRKLGIKKRIHFHRKFLGKKVSVLVEKNDKAQACNLSGFSENYILVHFSGPSLMLNTIQEVKITEVTDTGYVMASLLNCF